MTDNQFTKLIMRLLVAAYIIYLGFMLLTTAGASNHKVLFIIIGIFFLVADAGFIVFTIYSFCKSKKSGDK